MSEIDKPGSLYLGDRVAADGGAPGDGRLGYDARDLTTHAVIVGMTGSGKTGLGVILLEEALLAGVPCLVLDPKGDITNLMLTFPELRPEDFEPWVNPGDAERKGQSVGEFAAATAATWRKGLAASGIDGARIRRLREGARTTIFTPGSSAGVPLNVLGSLAAPGQVDDEAMRDEIASFAASLLGLAGIDADPITSREHILLSNLIDKAWREGRDLDLAGLIGEVQAPPLRKLGVFELDAFFPPKDRLALAMRLNGLVASPAFADWITGMPLDIGQLLRAPDGRPRASIVYLAHLSDAERQLVVTLILSKMVTWMRGQSGTTDLRALVYMDEVFGFAPPSATPPSKKPILTLLKQGRAFGVGMALATQNPVDLDYKAMSNAGTWFVGRLQTERDKERVLEGLRSASGDADIPALGDIVGSLAKRSFLLHSTHAAGPEVFSTRWAMSYLRGPLTRGQIQQLTADAPERAQGSPAVGSAGAGSVGTPGGGPQGPASAGADGPALAEDESALPPETASGVPVRYLSPSAPWAGQVGAVSGGRRLEPALVARVHLLYDDTAAGLEHREEWEAVFFPLTAYFDAGKAIPVDYDARDFVDAAPAGAVYALPDAPIHTVGFFRTVEKEIRDELYRGRKVEVFRNPALKLYSRVGESRGDFELRCASAAEDAADEETAKLRDRLEARIERLRTALHAADLRINELEVDVRERRGQELMAGAGDLIGALLGGRSSSAKIARAARSITGVSARRSQTARTGERLDSAVEKRDAKQEEIEAIETELAEEITAIDARWRDLAQAIEALAIGLERNDVDVDEVALVWLPRPG
ncbi:MAG: DUF87 domain-containing protein [Chloroflexi bacterium]|nr:DUF87 domain-containing protein [Chloroflexota bacterium]